jgi:hypothetical protein
MKSCIGLNGSQPLKATVEKQNCGESPGEAEAWVIVSGGEPDASTLEDFDQKKLASMKKNPRIDCSLMTSVGQIRAKLRGGGEFCQAVDLSSELSLASDKAPDDEVAVKPGLFPIAPSSILSLFIMLCQCLIRTLMCSWYVCFYCFRVGRCRFHTSFQSLPLIVTPQ